MASENSNSNRSPVAFGRVADGVARHTSSFPYMDDVPEGSGWRLTRQFGVLVGVMVTLVVANFLLVNTALERLHGAADMVNVVGRMRMLTVKTAYEASRLLAGPEAATVLLPSQEQLQQAVATLDRGGQVFGHAVRELSRENAMLLADVREQLGGFKSVLATARQETSDFRQRDAALLRIERSSEGVVRSVDALVAALARDANRDEQRLMVTLWGLLALNLVVLAVGFTAMRRRVVSPLIELTRLAREYAYGNFRDRSSLRSADEIGDLGRALNRMAGNTQNYVQRLDQLSNALEVSAAAAMITDANGRIEYVNARFEELTGYTAAEVVGKTPKILKSGLTKEETYREVWSFLLSGRPWTGEVLDRKKNGDLIWLHGAYAPIADENNGITHFVAVYQDLTAHKQILADLGRTNRMLRLLSACNETLVAAKDRDELLASVCRDIVEIGLFERVEVVLTDAQGACGYAYTRGQGGTQLSAHEVMGGLPRRYVRLPLQCDQGANRGALMVEPAEGGVVEAEEMKLLKELASDLSFGIAALEERLARQQAEKSLRLRTRAVESSSNGVVITDCSGASNVVAYVNPAFERITGFSSDEVVGRDPRLLLGRDDKQSGVLELRAALREQREGRALLANYRKDGSRFWNDLSISPVFSGDGSVTNFVGILNDVTPLIEYQEQLAHQANHDTLTGLANRNLLTDRLRQTLLQAHRNGTGFAVVFFDVDHFKFINDSLGHAAGDQVVCEIARRVKTVVRDVDTVARLGGDEFVVILPNSGNDVEVSATLQRILQTIAEPMLIRETVLQVSCSMGVSLYPLDGDDADTLLKNADAAMYEAKAHGRNQFQFYTREINLRVLERVTLEVSLREALRRSEFYLDFQPQCDMHTGKVVGAEALIRWRHPEKGVVAPSAFVPIAEEVGLIVEIGRWVLEAACAQMRKWLDSGLPPIKLAVNMSARQFQQKNLSGWIMQTLKLYGLQPGCLELELTESMLMQDPDEMARILDDIKQTGVRVSLDDFGTGYSSLSYLKRFPIDTLKLDKSFVRDITFDPVDAAISRAVITMAHSMGLKVVAEGVETEGQLNYLRTQHCNEMQGYYFSRPLKAEAFAELLHSGRALEFSASADDGCVLVLDSREGDESELAQLLSAEGYSVMTVETAAAAMEVLGAHDVRLIVADQRLHDMLGSEFLGTVRRLHPHISRILMTDPPDLEAVERAINHGGIHKLLLKPWCAGEVLLMAQEALKPPRMAD